MTPHEALRAATLDGARYLGLDGDIGSIEPGKLADLVVIDGDPLDQLAPEEVQRPPFWWERDRRAVAGMGGR
jgi:imidazolonepropionase-like amidohydrolase